LGNIRYSRKKSLRLSVILEPKNAVLVSVFGRFARMDRNREYNVPKVLSLPQYSHLCYSEKPEESVILRWESLAGTDTAR